jgi:hypothetical protein
MNKLNFIIRTLQNSLGLLMNFQQNVYIKDEMIYDFFNIQMVQNKYCNIHYLNLFYKTLYY